MNIINRTGYAFFIIILGCALFTAYELFIHLQFTSDGMHCYSAIRNMALYYRFWEGPAFEYMLGNHSYIAMYLLLAPIVKLISTPLVLASTNVITAFLTAFILYTCVLTINNPYRQTLGILFAILYLIYFMVFSSFFYDIYMFQPDCFLAPLVVLLFWAILKEKSMPFTQTAFYYAT